MKRVALLSGRYKLDSKKVKKESTIVGQHCAAKSVRCREVQSKVGKLWTEDDFETLGLDRFGVNVDKLKVPTPKPKKVFRAWRETWESVKLTKKDDEYEARLAHKYKWLKWRDLDNGNVLVSSHLLQMYYWKKKRVYLPITI